MEIRLRRQLMQVLNQESEERGRERMGMERESNGLDGHVKVFPEDAN